MTQQHTPGPWKVRPVCNSRSGFEIRGPGDIFTGQYLGAWICGEVYEANASLIAAAPDLLAALSEFVGAVDAGTTFADQSVVDLARAAIARATGGAA